MAHLGLAKTSQPPALQGQYPPLEFSILFNSVDKILLELLNDTLPADSAPHTEWVAKVSIVSTTRAANISIEMFLVDVHDHCLHC